MLQKLFKKSLFLLIFFSLFFSGNMVFAQLGGLDVSASKAGYSSDTDLASFVGSTVSLILGFIGVLFMIIIIGGGIIWMTSLGNQAKVDSAKKILLAGIIGLIIVIAAYAVTFTFSKLL